MFCSLTQNISQWWGSMDEFHAYFLQLTFFRIFRSLFHLQQTFWPPRPQGRALCAILLPCTLLPGQTWSHTESAVGRHFLCTCCVRHFLCAMPSDSYCRMVSPIQSTELVLFSPGADADVAHGITCLPLLNLGQMVLKALANSVVGQGEHPLRGHYTGWTCVPLPLFWDICIWYLWSVLVGPFPILPLRGLSGCFAFSSPFCFLSMVLAKVQSRATSLPLPM